MKRTVRLTERELKRMISESVRRVLRESENDDPHNWEKAKQWYDSQPDEYLKRDNGTYSTYTMRDPTNREDIGEYPLIDKMPKGGKNIVRKTTYSKDAHNNRGHYPSFFNGKEYIPGSDVEEITLDDLSFEELNHLLKQYENMGVGGVPGGRGTLMAWRDYWRGVLQNYVNNK